MTGIADELEAWREWGSLPDAWIRDLAGPDGTPRRIMLGLPHGEAPGGRFASASLGHEGLPAIYLLDADASFATMVETMRRCARRPDATGISPAAIIGISRPAGAGNPREARIADLTPGRSSQDVPEECGGLGGGEKHDGAAAFLTFIEEHVKPAVSARCGIDPARTMLFGHSLAGYFTLDTMVRRPEAFSAYAAISPSIWWNEQRLRDGIAHAARMAPRVLIGAGEWEDALAPWQAPDAALAERRAMRRMLARARDYSAALAEAFGPDRVRFEIFPDEDHASVLNVAMVRALRFLNGC